MLTKMRTHSFTPTDKIAYQLVYCPFLVKQVNGDWIAVSFLQGDDLREITSDNQMFTYYKVFGQII